MSNGDFLLALDPSLNGFGFAIIDIRKDKPKLIEVGTIQGRNKSWGNIPQQAKLGVISAKLRELRCKYYPLHKNIYIEKGFSRHLKSTAILNRVRGIVDLEFMEYELIELTPTQVKKTICGDGKATKEDVLESVCQILNVKQDIFETDDESDATAISICGLYELGKLKPPEQIK